MNERAGRRFRTKQERLAIVEETLVPGVSVSGVARKHDVNANQVFLWRRQYRAGWLGEETGALVPVKIVASTEVRADATTPSRPSKTNTVGVIEIQFGEARLRIEGAADPDCVRAAIEGLR